MQPLLDSSRRSYRIYVRGTSYLGDVLLLLVRIYWGSLLAESGWNKFANLTQTAAYFEHLGISWPKFNAILSGGVELGCGALLVIGLAARIAAVPLVINMVVAYIANSPDTLRHLFFNANEFVTAPEFLFLFACILVALFGPGMISVDGLLGIFLARLPAEGAAARIALRGGGPRETVSQSDTPTTEHAGRNRREFAKLTAAAFAGLFAGILIRRGPDHARNAAIPVASDGKAADNNSPPNDAPPGNPPPNNPTSASTDLNLMLAGDLHVCRGLNICRGKDKKHTNACAGQGSCATAESHACDGQNVCKGQGGCDNTAGINLCKGKGACAVPLKDATWKLARARFEQLAKATKLEIGAAPAKS